MPRLTQCRGAAYGISQASPSGGINAVWVMPEDEGLGFRGRPSTESMGCWTIGFPVLPGFLCLCVLVKYAAAVESWASDVSSSGGVSCLSAATQIPQPP